MLPHNATAADSNKFLIVFILYFKLNVFYGAKVGEDGEKGHTINSVEFTLISEDAETARSHR